MSDGKPGFSIESAAALMARDMITEHIRKFARVIMQDRHTNASTAAAYIDGLAGVTAMTIAGRHGSKDDVVNAVVKSLREAIDRDLRFMGRK